MKKIFFIFIFLLIILTLNSSVVLADETTPNFDEAIEGVLDGINEKDFETINQLLNEIFGEKMTFKDRVISFITGEIPLTIDGFKQYLLSGFQSVFRSVLDVMIYVIFIGILSTLLNVIISKNADKNEKSIIYYISYTLIISLIFILVFNVFNFAFTRLDAINKTVESVFPILLTLSEFSGGFGVAMSKPFLAFASLFTSVVSKGVFIPLLTASASCLIIGNLSETVKLESLNKSIQSLVKWILGIITLTFSVLIATQGVVNAQYGGISFKILKYATGSLIPIVGGFLSGGVDVLLSSAVLVKNSLGLIMVIYVLFSVIGAGITVLITSFIIKFSISIAEPILDKKIVNLINGISNLLSILSAIVLVSGFMYVLVLFNLITATGLIL